tara:strand:- start:295 stop:465 length:171 start_codon:yes stop_codon:yes gene_type:complete
MILNNGNISTINKLANDNPASIHGFEDLSIKRKAAQLASKIKSDIDVMDCFVEHYG